MEISAGIQASLAGRYASALFDLASENGAVTAVESDLDKLDAALAESAEMRGMIGNPEISRKAKGAAVDGVAGVLGAKRGAEKTPSELALVVDRDRAQRQQINPSVIAGVVGYALRGQQLPRFYRNGEEIEVRVRFREEDRESLTELADFLVPTADGEMLPLSSVTDSQFLPTPRSIVRRAASNSSPPNGRRSIG